jgi:indole-3-acetate monooxygenase
MLAQAKTDVSGEAVLERARQLAVEIAAQADAIERERRIPEPLLTQILDAGLYRMLLPRAVDGLEIAPTTYIRVIETIAAADASVAWCLGQANGCAMTAAYLEPAAARAVFGDPRAVLAWGPGPKARAVVVPGGYRVTGSFAFASGGRHATWLGAHVPIEEPDGKLRLAADGTHAIVTVLFPAEQAPMTDIWHVIGLRGTASDAYSLTDHFVPDRFTALRDTERARRNDAPLYRLTSLAMYTAAFGSVALGISRAMLDAFIAVARDKTARGASVGLKDSAVVQSLVGEAEAKHGAARLFLQDAVAKAWAGAQRGANGDGGPSIEERMAIRLAGTHAILQSLQVADTVYHEAGATAIFQTSPFERRFRDIHTVAQQVQGRRAHYESVGKHILGGPVDMMWI